MIRSKGGIDMVYFGLGISCFIYLTVVILFLIYVGNAIFGNYSFADNILPLLFLHSLFSVLILLWSLILMHGGYPQDMDISMDNTAWFILFLFILLFVEWLDWKVRRGSIRAGGSLKKLSRYLLPAVMVLVFFLATMFFYISCHSFYQLTTW